ncbi:MAG: hypothetical protein VB108_09395 [Anaerolineaceae bacterium]|nr:hypothetical protein [Anaerolineaceae bacterium]
MTLLFTIIISLLLVCSISTHFHSRILEIYIKSIKKVLIIAEAQQNNERFYLVESQNRPTLSLAYFMGLYMASRLMHFEKWEAETQKA